MTYQPAPSISAGGDQRYGPAITLPRMTHTEGVVRRGRPYRRRIAQRPTQ
jgi:hypothetical protein